MKRLQRGFTLIEMMIVTAIIGILAGLALPSLQGPLFRARRSDGIAALLQLQMSQEQWRSNNAQYASLADLRTPSASSLRHYTLAIAEATASGYSLVATAAGVQMGDRRCRVLRITVANGQATRTSGEDERSVNGDADNRHCWGI